MIYRKKKYIELNMDVYGSSNLPFEHVKEEYLKQYDLKGLAAESKKSATRTIERFEDMANPRTVADITQGRVDSFIQSRIKALGSNFSVNKDIGRLKAFINWLIRRGYYSGRLDISLMKTAAVIRKALTDDEIRSLLKACPSEAWQIRILLSLCTGLRAKDVDFLRINQIDLKRSTIDSESRKTGKVYLSRPIPVQLSPVLKRYVDRLIKSGVTSDSKLLPDTNIRKAWDAIRKQAGISSATRQKFRVTFSTWMQKLSGLESARDLLEHSSKKTTDDFYSDKELLLKIRVDRLPVKKWLKGIKKIGDINV